MATNTQKKKGDFDHLDKAVVELKKNRDRWAGTTNAEKIEILADIKTSLLSVAEEWAQTAARKKQIPEGSPLVGEEWISGPYTLMAGCNLLMQTLSGMESKAYLDHVPVRELQNGQIAATVTPHSTWDHLLFSGVKAEVWMQPGVTKSNLAANTARHYDVPVEMREGKIALVLGAGNIAAIAPLDCFQKLFTEYRVTLLKMNPVNDYLIEFLQVALKPLIDFGALRIVAGGADAGEYLCNHPDIDELHITGAQASHDIIVWGAGEEGEKNRKSGTPRNSRRITSELGAVCPTIVVPGPWTAKDISFQAEQVATQKLHNSGFNCVACQMLIVPAEWDKTPKFLEKIKQTMGNAPPRAAYYPGADERLDDFEKYAENVTRLKRSGAADCMLASFKKGDDKWLENTEVFAPAMTIHQIGGTDEANYLRAAVTYANDSLHGTLGANILIHPSTIRKMGEAEFEAIVTELHYGCIAINAWTGLGFLMVQTPWGAFPGHQLDDVQSGIGSVHNTYMFDMPERTVIKAPFRPFPRNLLSGSMTLLPRPPWFVTNKKQHKIGELLTDFQYKPSWFKLPRIFLNALLG